MAPPGILIRPYQQPVAVFELEYDLKIRDIIRLVWIKKTKIEQLAMSAQSLTSCMLAGGYTYMIYHRYWPLRQ
jgi:hypothetical protein